MEEHVKKAKLANYIEPHHELSDLKNQYYKFSKKVHEEMQDFENADFAKQRKTERAFYENTLTGTSGLTKHPEINHLAAAATLRLANESQVEAMGSVVKRHANARGSLNLENLSKEVFVAWNGPPELRKSDKLLEKALQKKYGDDPAE